MPRNRSRSATAAARLARREPSVAERIVWSYLRGSKLGFKFRREHPVGPYRIDFYCWEAKLAVDLDGEQHDPIRDKVRDAYLEQMGILTFRIPNRRLFEIDTDELYRDYILEIEDLCRSRTAGTER